MFSNPTVLEFPSPQTWYRIQRLKARGDTVRLGGFLLAPPISPIGRFDLIAEPTAYLADTPQTALYETLLRREARTCSLAALQARALATFTLPAGMRVVDLRSLAQDNPVLVSERYETTQQFAADCFAAGLDGVLYASAQHPQHDCLAVFPPALPRAKRISHIPLVKPGTVELLPAVITAIRGARVPLID